VFFSFLSFLSSLIFFFFRVERFPPPHSGRWTCSSRRC
jgi:hypothetical protein